MNGEEAEGEVGQEADSSDADDAEDDITIVLGQSGHVGASDAGQEAIAEEESEEEVSDDELKIVLTKPTAAEAGDSTLRVFSWCVVLVLFAVSCIRRGCQRCSVSFCA